MAGTFPGWGSLQKAISVIAEDPDPPTLCARCWRPLLPSIQSTSLGRFLHHTDKKIEGRWGKWLLRGPRGRGRASTQRQLCLAPEPVPFHQSQVARGPSYKLWCPLQTRKGDWILQDEMAERENSEAWWQDQSPGRRGIWFFPLLAVRSRKPSHPPWASVPRLLNADRIPPTQVLLNPTLKIHDFKMCWLRLTSNLLSTRDTVFKASFVTVGRPFSTRLFSGHGTHLDIPKDAQESNIFLPTYLKSCYPK